QILWERSFYEFGGRSASVVQLSNSTKLEETRVKVGTDLIAAQMLIEVPLAKTIKLTTAGRVTHQDIANTSFFNLNTNFNSPDVIDDQNDRNTNVTVRPGFNFNDLYTRLSWELNEHLNIGASFFTSFDKYDYLYQETYQRFRIDRRPLTITETGKENISWRNLAFGFQLNNKWSKKLETNINLSRSSYSIGSRNSFEINTVTFNGIERINIKPGTSKLNQIDGLRLDIKTEWNIDQKHQLTFGLNGAYDEIDIDIRNSNGLEDRALVNDENASTYSAFVQHSWRPFRKLNVMSGLHTSYFNKMDRLFLSPRIRLTYDLNEHINLKGSFGIYQQFLRQLYHEDVFATNQVFWVLAGNTDLINRLEIPFVNAEQYMLGASFSHKGWTVDVELYHKFRNGILEYALRRPGFSQQGTVINPIFGFFEGTGKTNGMDILIKKDAKKYSAWLAYTLSENLHQLDGVNFDQPFPSPEDSRHQIKWVNQYKFNNSWSVMSTYIFSSGLPYLDYTNLLERPASRRQFSYAPFLSRYKAYHRMDLSLTHKTKIFKLDTQIGLSVFNVFNRENIRYRQFVFSDGENTQRRIFSTDLELLPRIWNLSVEVGIW
ncbi:MAG: TonB-dependent receptor, partial [Bacteroidota bacterium]